MRSHITTNETFSLKRRNENELTGGLNFIHAKIIALFLAAPRASRLTSPFVAATRRIRAFSAPVPKPNNAADESKEKLKGKAGGMHEGRRPGVDARRENDPPDRIHPTCCEQQKTAATGQDLGSKPFNPNSCQVILIRQRFCSFL